MKRSQNPKLDLAIVIPAFNEERVIGASLTILTKVIDAAHIYVVSDGSTDKTVKIARKYVPNVLGLTKNVGKAEALQSVIKKYKLDKNYRYLLFSDADSRLAPGFLESIQALVPQEPACIVGTVCSDKNGLISAYRTYEYGYGFNIIKRAQDIMRVITVAPGCASLYRSDILNKLEFSGRTLTEDFDLTLQIHLKKLGEILYAPGAKVYTQDPFSLSDYWKQIVRWNTGFWQNLFLHRLYLPKGRLNAEIWLMLFDTITWIASLALLRFNPHFFELLLLWSYGTTMLFAAAILGLQRAWWALLYTPLFPFFQILNIAAYFYSLGRAVRNNKKSLTWNKVERLAIEDSLLAEQA